MLTRKVPSKAERYFTTGISMITSQGSLGPNVMAAEWAIQISYDPILIAIFVHQGSQTLRNILARKEFGINMASREQTTQVSIAGGYSGSEIDKLKIKNLFKMLKPRKIKTPLIAGCTINAECRMVQKKRVGDHVMVVGKVLYMKYDDTKSPLLYHGGRYFDMGRMIEPERIEIKTDKYVLEFFKHLAGKKFVVKCAGVIVKSGNRIMVMRYDNALLETLPLCVPPQGSDQRDYLVKFLKSAGFNIMVDARPVLKRVILRHQSEIQRANILLFYGKNKSGKDIMWKSSKDAFISKLV